jgi:hypothetical protein
VSSSRTLLMLSARMSASSLTALPATSTSTHPAASHDSLNASGELF